MPADLVVVTQDPRFGGGLRSQLQSFLDAAAALGRTVDVHFVAHPSFRGDTGTMIETRGAPGSLARVDALNQLVGARRLAPVLAEARSVWVVSTVASAGGAALRSGRPYSCWIGTGLRDEWAARRPGLPPSRRLALSVNAPVLLELERRVLRSARGVYATSPRSRRSVAAAGGLALDHVRTLPIAVDPERFAPLPEDEWLAGLEPPVLAFVGRADDPRKNLRLLLEAWPEIRRRVPGVTLRLIGRPPRGSLPEGVESAGVVTSVPDQLRRAALLVIPSLQEGFGVVAAEALACGVPVLATPSGGPEHLIRASRGGRVVSSFRPEELAEATADLLSAPERLLPLREAGRTYVAQEHSPERLRDLLAAALEEDGAGA